MSASRLPPLKIKSGNAQVEIGRSTGKTVQTMLNGILVVSSPDGGIFINGTKIDDQATSIRVEQTTDGLIVESDAPVNLTTGDQVSDGDISNVCISGDMPDEMRNLMAILSKK